MILDSALSAVSRERAARLTLDLVSIPSPTGDTAAVAHRFADELAVLGMEVSWFREFPKTPVAIGRLRGTGGGPTLILNGHLDTVPIPHAPPERKDGRVYGRGTVDMKGPVAAAAEAVRAAQDAGVRFKGDVVLCAHGLHEAPGGRGEDLEAALRAGAIRGDAAVVLECGHDALPVVQLGLGIFHVTFRRDGEVNHELRTAAGTPNPAFAVAEAALAIRDLNLRLSATHIEHVGPESAFLGQVHCGDFYNRFSNTAWLEGTRRYAPEKTFEEVGVELRSLMDAVAERNGVIAELDWSKVRDGFRISEAHPLVDALRQAYTAETGRLLPATGNRVVADASLFAHAGVPCLYHGLDGGGAHGDVEFVYESELERAARVYLRTMASYLGVQASES